MAFEQSGRLTATTGLATLSTKLIQLTFFATRPFVTITSCFLKGELMATSTLKKFMVLYLVPAEVMANWAKTDPAVRKPAEQKMQADWQRWMGEHGKIFSITEAAGKTKAVTASGVVDARNDILLYSIIEAENQDVAVRFFADHPHLTIPQSSIQVMEVRPLGPM
jgi:hypothetical protein